PANLVNTAAASGATTCGAGTVTAANGGGSVVLASGTVPANGSCNVTVNVTSATAGSYANSTGSVTTTNAGSAASASATLTGLVHGHRQRDERHCRHLQQQHRLGGAHDDERRREHRSGERKPIGSELAHGREGVLAGLDRHQRHERADDHADQSERDRGDGRGVHGHLSREPGQH